MKDPRAYRRVAGELERRIASGTYPRESRLPPIAALADEFDVSRDTVQKALAELAGAGLIERFPGLGWYVSDK